MFSSDRLCSVDGGWSGDSDWRILIGRDGAAWFQLDLRKHKLKVLS